jgi:hypothetical protein
MTADLTSDERDALLEEPAGFDPVNWPAHYNQSSIECIDAMRAAFGNEAVASYCKLAAFKYLWRADHKGIHDQDVRKAIWYLRFAIGDDPREDRP